MTHSAVSPDNMLSLRFIGFLRVVLFRWVETISYYYLRFCSQFVHFVAEDAAGALVGKATAGGGREKHLHIL